MFWFSDNGFKKKGKVGRVFIFCFYFQSNMGRVFIFAELCKSIFVGDFTDIKEVGENNNPFVNFDLKYEVSVGKSKSLRVNTIVLFVCQNSRMKF
jgi:hypothetical protein